MEKYIKSITALNSLYVEFVPQFLPHLTVTGQNVTKRDKSKNPGLSVFSECDEGRREESKSTGARPHDAALG